MQYTVAEKAEKKRKLSFTSSRGSICEPERNGDTKGSFLDSLRTLVSLFFSLLVNCGQSLLQRSFEKGVFEIKKKKHRPLEFQFLIHLIISIFI